MISGRYRTESLCRFWSSNTAGFCEASTCDGVRGDLEHLLISCPALKLDRDRVYNLWLLKSRENSPLFALITSIMSASPTEQVKFILNPCANPEILKLVQTQGTPLLEHITYLTRTFAFNMHRKKLILTGRWIKPWAKK